MTLQNKIFCYIVTMTSKRKDDEMSNTLEQLEDFERMSKMFLGTK